MTTRISLVKGIVLMASAVLATACGAADPGMAVPTAHRPLPSPRPAFTGLPVPATLAAPSRTPTAAGTVRITATAAASGQARDGTPAGTRQLTVLYTNDTRGYVDPCG